MRREELLDADCGIAQTLGLVGDWWAWLIVREVAGGLTRFDAMQAELGISRRALAERLARLVEHDVLRRTPYSAHPPRHDYRLTARGEGLLPVLLALQEFGDRFLLGDGSATASARGAEAQRLHGLLGRRVPALSLPAHDRTHVDLHDGGWKVLFLFPGAFAPDTHGYPPGWGEVPGTPGCTLEARTYAARHERFAALGCAVYGVSTQRADQQAAFAAFAGLPYRLLSDQDGVLATALRLPVFRIAGEDRFKRHSLLLDADATVRHVQAPVTDPAGSVDEMLAAVGELRG